MRLSPNERISAIQPRVTRAEAARLVREGLTLEQRLDMRDNPPITIPEDARQHLLSTDIALVMTARLAGLTASSDPASGAHWFRPQDPVLRKGAAALFTDLWQRLGSHPGHLTGDAQKTAVTSPTDVFSNSTWWTPIDTVLHQGLMKGDITNAFQPEEPISGVDFVLGLLKLRESLPPDDTSLLLPQAANAPQAPADFEDQPPLQVSKNRPPPLEPGWDDAHDLSTSRSRFPQTRLPLHFR
jgi:hypothetical protein